ncbi:MAG: efflux RND transporter periplasmic adaptor subunit [Pseudomonadales bacterium]|nr:efflux RND transporter periplasmic adaptor subunit [Pseudomonadales bacterium]
MKKQQIVAAAILVAVIAWMAVPRDTSSTAEEPEVPERQIAAIPEGASPAENPEQITVRARQISEEDYVERIRVRGRTQAFRHVQVRAEQAGRIISDPVARGSRVSAGDLLCEIAVDGRDVALEEARARLEEAEFEYQAGLDLQSRNLQSAVQVAQLKSAVAAAESAVTRAELALEDTRILAPYDGIVEQRTVEVGDLLNIGDVCASVIDDDPMLLVGLVPEGDVSRIEEGARVNAELLGGQRLTGRVTFLASAADAVSRSYRMEVTVDPSQQKIREGITTEMLVNAAQLRAHRIPSSALTLDDAGEIGVKVIDRNNVVRFSNVTIVGDDSNQMNPAVWVTGLSGSVNLITLGQEIVFPGQTIEANFDWDAQSQR